MKRKIIIGSVVLIAVLAFMPLAVWWYVFHTQAGVELALAQLHRLQNVRMTVAGVSGTLAGPLTVERFELDDKHVNIVANDVRLDLTPIALLAQTIRVETASIAQVRVQLKNFDSPPTDAPPRFMPGFLRLSVGDATVNDARVVTVQGTVIEASNARGAVTLTSQRLEVGQAAASIPNVSAAGTYTLLAKRPVEMRFVGMVRAGAGRNAELVANLDFSGTPQAFQATGELTAPSPASFDATLRRDADAWRTEGKIASEGFSLAPWIDNPPFSLRAAKLTITANNADVRVQGTVIVPEFDSQPIDVDAQGRYAQRTLTIAPIALRLSDSDFALTANGRIDMSGERPAIAAQAQWINLRWPPRASQFVSPQGQLTLSGTLPYDFETQGDVRLNNGMTATLVAAGELSNTTLKVDRYAIAALEGNIAGDAQLMFAAPQTWKVRARAAQLNPVALHERLRGRVNVDARAHGSGLGRDASFALDVRSISGTLLGESLTASGALARQSVTGADTWTADNIVAALGNNRLEIDGNVGQKHDLNWSAQIESLATFLEDADGSLTSSGVVRGPRDAPAIDAEISARDLAYGDWRATEAAIAVNVNLDANERSDITATATQIGWRNLRLEELRVLANGATEAHAIELHATLSPNNRSRLSGLNISASGGYENKRWRGEIAPLQLIDRESGAPSAQASPATAYFSANDAAAESWCVTWADRKLCARGHFRGEPAPGEARRDELWRIDVQSDPMPLDMFDGLLGDDARLNGQWQLRANARAERNAPWTVNAALLMSDATLAYQPVEGAEEIVQLGSGRADFTATAANYEMQLELATPGTTNIAARAQVARPGGQQQLADAPLTGSLQARTADANLLPLLLVDLDHAAGNLRVDLEARGTLGSPSLFGDIELANGELDLYRYNLALREMNVAARIDDNRVRFNGGGRAGEGELRVDGDLQWRGEDTVGAMRIRGERLLVSDLPDYRVVASPDVRFAIDGRRIDVTGNVTIPSANIQPADLRGAVQRSPDVRLINEPPRDADRGFAVYSNIEVRIGDDVNIDSYGLTGKLGGAVTAATRPNETPRGRGELSIGGGHYEAYGQDLEIERGRLLFDAAPLDNPGLDILAIRRVEDQRVGVNVRGTLRAPRLTLYAEPSLPQTQIVAYLLTGKPVEDMRSSDTVAVGNATDALALQGGSLLVSQLGRRVGLEQVSVESNGLDDTSLVLGKFLSPRLFVSYGISLTESFNTLKARYTISERWLFKTESGQHQSADVEFRIER